MQKKHDNQLVGVIMILLGFYWACRSLGMFQFSIFFDGWWSFIIIIPCFLNYMQGKSRGTSLGGILFGVLLLLWRQQIIPGSYIPAIFLSLVFVMIGISIMMSSPKIHPTQKADQESQTSSYQQRAEYEWGRDSSQQNGEYQPRNEYQERGGYQPRNEYQERGEYQPRNEYQERGEYQPRNEYQESGEYQPRNGYQQEMKRTSSYSEYQSDGKEASGTQSKGKGQQASNANYSTYETCPPNISAILIGKSVSCLSGVFRGTNIQSVLGNVQLDLRQAVLEQDVYVNVNLILGGADIFLPENVRVICETQSILGDVRDVRKCKANISTTQPAIHIVGTCILGGLELK